MLVYMSVVAVSLEIQGKEQLPMKLIEVLTFVSIIIDFVGLVLEIMDLIKRNKKDRS